MIRRRGLAMVLAVLALAGCRKRLSSEERRDLQAWLLCEECNGGERQRVEALGDRATPALATALRDGPPAAGRANMAAQIRDLFGRLGGAAALGVTEATFVGRYLDNYVITYRTRSALSLGDIGTPDALEALRRAAAADSSDTAPLPDAIRRAVEGALAQSFPAYSGVLADSSVSAFDTLIIRRGTSQWDGNETAIIRGAPFGDLLIDRGGDSLRIVAVAYPGSYALTIENDGPGPARVPIRIQSLRYVPHPASGAPQLGGGPFPQRRFLAIAPPPTADTIDHYKFTAVGSSLTITARATWAGPKDVDLGWRACEGGAVGNTDGATANNPETTTVTIPPGGCWLLTVTGRGPGAAALVRLDLLVP